ncbi:hypothetical protein ACIREO_39330 [Streptomyces sp. NPDC102441]|uniref:hypothetical protein n=1 Tax=Streptomyces sp. NPDC102441 TaxID=3366176 RepID=UPI00381FB924
MAQGATLGEALSSLLRDHGARPQDRLKSYRAKDWHAQLVQLTGTHRGYEALERAGVNVTARTLVNWLAEPEYAVRRSYQEQIRSAYEDAATIPPTPVPPEFVVHQFRITGTVQIARDIRDRGTRGEAPLRIDGRNGAWSRIEQAWLTGQLTGEVFEEYFIDDIIVEDIGDGTDGWQFPGDWYQVI